MEPSSGIHSVSRWLRLLLGLMTIFGAFHWAAVALGSDRGQAGLIVCGVVVAGIVAVERVLFGERVPDALRTLGLGMPRAKGVLVAGGSGLLLLCVGWLYVETTAASSGLLPGWTWLIAGLFAQAGVAEEILFRGYLFRRLRIGRSFWRAAVVSMVPFVGVHLLLFLTMPWPIALTATLLAVVLSFPFAHLFEMGGGTIWAPALLHFVIQGTVKIVVISGDGSFSFPLLWMLASALIPLSSFLASRPQPMTQPIANTDAGVPAGAATAR